MHTNYKGESPDVQVLFKALDKLKAGEFLNISTSKMWRENKQRLIDCCYNYIVVRRSEGVDHYWLSMDETIFFHE